MLGRGLEEEYHYLPYISFQEDGSVDWLHSYFIELAFDNSSLLQSIGEYRGYLFANLSYSGLLIFGVIGSFLYIQRQNEQDRRKLRIVIAQTSEGYCAMDLDLMITETNPAFATMVNLPGKVLQGRNFLGFLTPESRARWRDDVFGQERCYRFDAELYTGEEAPLPVIVKRTAVLGKDRNPEYYFAFISDVSEEKKVEEYVRHMAYHDPLTGLPNRKYLMEKLEGALEKLMIGERMIALLFMDLDNFKTVNDMHGHGMGDLLLAQIGNRLRELLRHDDMVARLGGDEFILFVSHLKGREGAGLIADKVLGILEKPFLIQGIQFLVEISIGIAVAPLDTWESQDLIKKADMAMYRAKMEGLGYCYYDPYLDRESKRKES